MSSSYAAYMTFKNEPETANALRFATAAEAEAYAADLFSRWTYPDGYVIRETADPVTYVWIDRGLSNTFSGGAVRIDHPAAIEAAALASYKATHVAALPIDPLEDLPRDPNRPYVATSTYGAGSRRYTAAILDPDCNDHAGYMVACRGNHRSHGAAARCATRYAVRNGIPIRQLESMPEYDQAAGR